VEPHPSFPPAQSLKEGETIFDPAVTCHLPTMASPGPNRSPGAGLLHATDEEEAVEVSSEEEDDRAESAASARW